MTNKELTTYIEQHAFISDEVKDIMLMLIKERDYCANLPDEIVKVKDLITYLRCLPQEDVLMISTDAEDVLEHTDIILNVDDVCLGHGTFHGITFLKVTGLKKLTNKVKEETVNEFAEQLRPFLNTYYDQVHLDETAEKMKKELVDERKCYE